MQIPTCITTVIKVIKKSRTDQEGKKSFREVGIGRIVHGEKEHLKLGATGL